MNIDNINSDLVEKFALSLSENERDNLKYKLSLLAKEELYKADTINKYQVHLKNKKLNTLLECLIKIHPYKNRIGEYGMAYKGRPKFITDELLHNLLKESEELSKNSIPNFNQYISQVETEDNSTICEKFASSQELIDFVSLYAGPVTPSFITSYIYYSKKGQESKVHIDNAFTSITVMIGLKQVNKSENNIELSSSFVYWPDKEPLYYRLLPGEMSIFFGASVLHGRTKLHDGEITNSLLISFRPDFDRIFESFLEKTQYTNNFFLEPITIRHSKTLFELLQPTQLYTYIPINAPKSKENLEAKYEKWEKRYSPDKKEIWLNYAIFDKKDKTYKGTLQATIIREKETYIAYEVFPEYWRKGIAKESVAKLIDILFNKFHIKKISAHIDTRNIPSLKLLESLGFKSTRKINEADFFKGSRSDEFVYELNRQNWVK